MSRPGKNAGLVSNVVLAILLIAAQSGALAHAWEHDPGTPQNQACASCVTASQLGSACVDNLIVTEAVPFSSVLNVTSEPTFDSTHAFVARQRGPPASL